MSPTSLQLVSNDDIVLSFFNPLPTMLFNSNFQPLEVVRRYRDPQLQVVKIIPIV